MKPQPWLLVSGDFTPLGGMDRANHALAMYLGRRPETEVHLVTHRAWDDLEALSSVRVHQVRRPLGSRFLGMPLLDQAGRHWARRLASRGGRVVVNGGNCGWADVNWVHYVHAAWAPRSDAHGSLPRRLKAAAFRRYALWSERSRVAEARLVIANSRQTRAALIERLGLPPERVYAVYYGIDAERFRPAAPAERAETRARLGWSEAEAEERPIVLFVGALGDRRKGFDTVFQAWQRLSRDRDWDARLVVVGTGAALPAWQARVAEAGLDRAITFLGFRTDVPELLRAGDALVSPSRYEAYGLNVHEALCCGLPALVSAASGVAEQYPETLRPLLLPDPDDADDLAERLRAWRSKPDAWRQAVAPVSQTLRARTWDVCASEIVTLISRQ